MYRPFFLQERKILKNSLFDGARSVVTTNWSKVIIRQLKEISINHNKESAIVSSAGSHAVITLAQQSIR